MGKFELHCFRRDQKRRFFFCSMIVENRFIAEIFNSKDFTRKGTKARVSSVQSPLKGTKIFARKVDSIRREQKKMKTIIEHRCPSNYDPKASKNGIVSKN